MPDEQEKQDEPLGGTTAQDENVLGAFIARTREAKGLTLRDVEAASGGRIKNGYLSQVENGKIQSPSPAMLNWIAQALSIEHEDLMTLAGYFAPSEGAAAIEERELQLILMDAKNLTAEDREEVRDYMQMLQMRRRREKKDE